MKSGFSCFSKVILLAAGISGVGGLIACAPEPATRHFKEANRDFGPTRTDGELEEGEVKLATGAKAASIRWKGDIATVSWLRAADDLNWLASKMASPELAGLSLRMHEAVTQETVSWATTVANSAYASAAIGETRASTAQSVTKGVTMLKAQEPLIEDLLKKRNAKTRWPTTRISLGALIDQIDGFIANFVKDVETSTVDKTVRRRIVDELRITVTPKLQRFREAVAAAYDEKKTYEFVAKIRKVLNDEGLNLGAQTAARLELAENLPREVERIVDAKSALSVLVDFWRASSVETRETKFKVLAPELYDFFKGQSEDDLECVRTGCGFFTRIKRALFVLPAIEEYGIPKLRKDLADAAENSIRKELEEEAVKFLPSLHVEIRKQIIGEISHQREHIEKISKNYGDYLRVVMNRMAASKLGLDADDSIASVEPRQIRADLDFSGSSRNPVKVTKAPRQSRSGFETGAEVIGAGMATAAGLHDSAFEMLTGRKNSIRLHQTQARLFFEVLGKILMVGGFKNENGKPFDAFAVTVTNRQERFNLRTQMASPLTYAVPDLFCVGKPGRGEFAVASEMKPTIAVHVASQAELLRGLGRAAESLRDWTATPFDHALGAITVADFVPDLPREALDLPMFPKDLFFAAAVGNAGTILQNISKSMSTVALINPAKQIHWANEKVSTQDPEQRAIMATMFDLENGKRALLSNTVDTARFLIAVTQFLRATDGIERTRADVLLKTDGKGKRPLDQLVAARADLKLLTLALANFLSSEALGPDGLVRPLYKRSAQNIAMGASGEPQLLDQAIVIRALLDASEAISAAVFRTSALDLLSATNEVFFQPAIGFYVDDVKTSAMPNLETMTAMLVAGERALPYMATWRATQWKNMSRAWIGALRDAAEMDREE